MKKVMTHEVIITTRHGGFKGNYVDTTIKCRLLTHHIVLEDGTKYKKIDGDKVNAHKYMGQYMENTRVKPNTLQELKMKKEEIELDELYEQAKSIVLKDRRTSLSYLQRKLFIGYNRTNEIMIQMEKMGIVTEFNIKGLRDIID